MPKWPPSLKPNDVHLRFATLLIGGLMAFIGIRYFLGYGPLILDRRNQPFPEPIAPFIAGFFVLGGLYAALRPIYDWLKGRG